MAAQLKDFPWSDFEPFTHFDDRRKDKGGHVMKVVPRKSRFFNVAANFVN